MVDPQKLTATEFAQSIKAKYPDYAEVPDDVLAAKMLEKYPEYRDRVVDVGGGAMNFAIVNGQRVPVENLPVDQKYAGFGMGAGGDPSRLVDNLRTLKDMGVGAAKGFGSSVVGLGQLAHQIPGVSPAIDAVYKLAGQQVNSAQSMRADPQASLGMTAENGPERLGKLLEQMAEYAIPAGAAERTGVGIAQFLRPYVGKAALARVAPQMFTQGLVNAGVATVQGADPLVAGAVGAAGPAVMEGVGGASRLLKGTGESLVRAAIKPTVSSMKKLAGASQTGIEAQANRLTRFIIDNRLTSPEKAQAIIDGAEQALQDAIQSAGDPLTDAPARTMRYLAALKASAAKQGLPSHDVGIIANAAKEVIRRSNMGEDVTRMVLKANPQGLVDAAGKPVMTAVPVTSRELKAGVPASSALGSARATSQWTTRKAYGEMKGAQTEAAKATERAARDAVKQSVPVSKPILQRQSQAITARETLDRMAHRAANRDAVSLPAHVMAAAELAQGRPPVLALAANWLRNNQLKAGIYADQLSRAIARRDVRTVTLIMERLGAGAAIQTTKPAYSTGGG